MVYEYFRAGITDKLGYDLSYWKARAAYDELRTQNLWSVGRLKSLISIEGKKAVGNARAFN
jgi:hypothetical protein